MAWNLTLLAFRRRPALSRRAPRGIRRRPAGPPRRRSAVATTPRCRRPCACRRTARGCPPGLIWRHQPFRGEQHLALTDFVPLPPRLGGDPGGGGGIWGRGG